MRSWAALIKLVALLECPDKYVQFSFGQIHLFVTQKWDNFIQTVHVHKTLGFGPYPLSTSSFTDVLLTHDHTVFLHSRSLNCASL